MLYNECKRELIVNDMISIYFKNIENIFWNARLPVYYLWFIVLWVVLKNNYTPFQVHSNTIKSELS